MNGFSEKLPEGVDYDDDGYCDDCGAKAIWPPTGEPHYAVCSAGCKTVAINAKAALSALPPQPDPDYETLGKAGYKPGFRDAVVEQCDKCTRRAMHHVGRSGVTMTLCCEHYVADGHPPADWHPDCMKAALSVVPPQPAWPTTHAVETMIGMLTPFPDSVPGFMRREYSVSFMREVAAMLWRLSAAPPQPASPVGAGDLEIVARAIAKHHYEEAENCESQFEAGTEDFDSAEEYVEKEWKGWKYFAQAAITAMPRAGQGDVSDEKITEIARECFRYCHPIDDWVKGKHGDSDLEQECIDLLRPYLASVLNLHHPLNAPKSGDAQMEEALRAIVNALARLCYLRDHKKQYGEDVYYRSSKTQAWKSAEAALTHLATLEAAVGGKGV